MPSCRFPVFLSALALLGVLKLIIFIPRCLFDRTFLSHHRTCGVLCPATCGHQLCPHVRTPAVSYQKKTKTIKINNLLFISILFYENQQTTPKFKVAPSLRSGILRSGFAIGDRVSSLTLTIKMPVSLCIW